MENVWYANESYPTVASPPSGGGSYVTGENTDDLQTHETVPPTLPPRPADVSAEENAYEEGKSLAEEDRRNGTRSHEGDDYNDCDDDYDEGYDE